MNSFHRCGRRFLLSPLLLLLALPACQRPEEPPQPADLLPRAQMTVLLADMHQLEAQVENSHLSSDSATALFLAQQKALLWRHQTTDSIFQRSYRYYGIHGKDLNEIYLGVLDTLTRRQARLTPAPATPPPAQWAPPKTN